MIDLNSVRGEIDKIDNELVRLFLKRLELVGDVVASKRERGASIYDPAREREILSRVTAEAGPEYENGARLFFTTLFDISKARQRVLLSGGSPLIRAVNAATEKYNRKFPTRAVVACCGTEGSYVQQAISLMFPLPTIAYFTNFEKVFEAVESGLCPYGVLPIENSAAGSVAAVYDLMVKHRFRIVRAQKLKIDHVLLAPHGVKFEDVTEVRSHQHALSQCKNFFRAHPKLVQRAEVNTAVAAREVAGSDRRDVAVIASRPCAELYGLNIIADGIQDTTFNSTRFICISKDLEIYPDANKFSVMLSIPHRPGSLAAIVSKFAAIDVNLTKIEARALPGMDFEYLFTFDFMASPTDPNVLSLLSELSQDPEVERFAFLGAYAEK